MDPIYLDYNATTPLSPSVWDAMQPYCTEVFGNPASAHQAGRRARQALEDAREQTAALLSAHPDEVIFTSGATEANNLAILGIAGDPPGRLITSPIEHPCVVEPFRRLEEVGFTVDRLPVTADGIVSVEALPGLLRPETRLVSVMLVNHETGSVQPIRALVESASRGREPPVPAFHCDAAQAVGKMPVHFRELGVTALTLSAHKFHGPKGIGALLLRRGTKLRPLLHGGHQQQGRRPGTEPVALAVGLAAALQICDRQHETRLQKVRRLRQLFLEHLLADAGPVLINGPTDAALPHTLNLSFPGCRSDVLLINLDLVGVACSTGSACSSGSLLPSPVLRAMGVSEERLHSAMRFSLSPLLTEEAVSEAARRIADVVCRLRKNAI